jgi:hypothetical protein
MMNIGKPMTNPRYPLSACHRIILINYIISDL